MELEFEEGINKGLGVTIMLSNYESYRDSMSLCVCFTSLYIFKEIEAQKKERGLRRAGKGVVGKEMKEEREERGGGRREGERGRGCGVEEGKKEEKEEEVEEEKEEKNGGGGEGKGERGCGGWGEGREGREGRGERDRVAENLTWVWTLWKDQTSPG